MSNEETKQAPAEGHGMTSAEAREAGIGGKDLQPGKDYVVEYGREAGMESQPQTKSGGTQPASQPLNDDMNDDDISQRQGASE